MLKANLKIWAIIMVICLIGQFFWAAVPGWIERGKQEAQIEIVKREEERLQSSHISGLEPIENNPVETESVIEDDQTSTIATEKTNENSETTEEEEKTSLPIGFIIIAVLVILMMVFVLTI